MVSRGGRGDRIGRYGNTHSDHNFRDMDYRGYGQEDEDALGYEVGAEGDRPYGQDEQSVVGHDFPPSGLDNHLGFHLRGEGRGDIGREGKGLLWPPCSQSQPDLALPVLQREDDGSRIEFELLQTSPHQRGRGRGGRGFPENSATLSGSSQGNWGESGAHSELTDFSTARQREEDRRKRRVSHNKDIVCIVLIKLYLVVDTFSNLLLFCADFSIRVRGAWLYRPIP